MYGVSHLNELNCLLTRQGYFISTFEIQITTCISQLTVQPLLFGHVFLFLFRWSNVDLNAVRGTIVFLSYLLSICEFHF